MAQGVGSAWLAWPAAIAVSGLLATAIGAMCLRTRGVYFIMITLSLAQMLYFLANSAKGYGGDEGLTLRVRSTLPFELSLKDDATFYWLALGLLALCLWALHRFVHSPAGRAVLARRAVEAATGKA